MRALRRLARSTVATAAAVLLLAGCGGDDNDDNASSSAGSTASSSSSGSSESAGSGDSDVEGFCSDAQAFAKALGSVDPATPEEIPTALDEASAAFEVVT